MLIAAVAHDDDLTRLLVGGHLTILTDLWPGGRVKARTDCSVVRNCDATAWLPSRLVEVAGLPHHRAFAPVGTKVHRDTCRGEHCHLDAR